MGMSAFIRGEEAGAMSWTETQESGFLALSSLLFLKWSMTKTTKCAPWSRMFAYLGVRAVRTGLLGKLANPNTKTAWPTNQGFS